MGPAHTPPVAALTTPRFSAPFALAFTLSMAALAQCCMHRPPRNVREVQGGGPHSAAIAVRSGDLRADDTFGRTLGDCRYTAYVRGNVGRTLYGSAGEPFGAVTYAPAVTITSQVACAGDERLTETTTTLESEDLTRDSLLRELAGTGAVRAEVDGRTCTFRPYFGLDSDRVFVTEVTRTCER
jgi:hypothetical protein